MIQNQKWIYKNQLILMEKNLKLNCDKLIEN